MSTLKTSTIAAVAILTIGIVPVALQRSGANSLKGEFEKLRETAAKLEQGVPRSIHQRVGDRHGDGDGSGKPVARYLAVLERPLAADEVIEEITAAMMSQDMSATMRIILRLAKLSPEASRELIAEVRASETSGLMKEEALQFLSSIVSRPDQEDAPGDALDQDLHDGVNTNDLGNSLGDWVKNDPDAAIAWFNSRRDSGQLAGKAINDTPGEASFFSGLMDGLAQTDPDRALLLLETVDAKTRAAGIQSLASRLAVQEDQRERALALVNTLESADARGDAARRAASLLERHRMPEAALAFIEGSNLDDENLAGVIAMLAIERGGEGSSSWETRAAWAQEHVPESARPALSGKLVMGGFLNFEPEEIFAWVDGLSGSERDVGLSAQATMLSSNSESGRALESAQSIADESLRDTTVRAVLEWANQRNAKAAAQLAGQHGLDLEQILGNKPE